MSTRTLAAMAAIGLALGVGADGARAAFPGANGRIAFAVQEWRRADPCLGIPQGCEPEFVSSRIETVRPDGRGRLVLRARAVSTDPVWSPDRRWIAFLREGDIYVMRSDGRRVRRILDAPSEDLAHPERPWLQLSGPAGSRSRAELPARGARLPVRRVHLPAAHDSPCARPVRMHDEQVLVLE